MTDSREDILVEIPNKHLPKLAKLFEVKAPWAPYMVSLIHSAIRWKHTEKSASAVTLFSPHNCWEIDGTVIVLITITTKAQDVVIFTLDDECTNLYQGLQETNLLDYSNKRTWFYGVHEKHLKILEKYIQNKNLKIYANIPCTIHAMSSEDALKVKVECPSDVYIKNLTPTEAQQITDLWPPKFPDAKKYISRYIEYSGGYGVFLKSNNQMVAWIMRHTLDHLAMLHTVEGFRAKGYGSLVTKALSKEIGKEGLWPVALILQLNTKSINMFEKLGFNNIGNWNIVILEGTLQQRIVQL